MITPYLLLVLYTVTKAEEHHRLRREARDSRLAEGVARRAKLRAHLLEVKSTRLHIAKAQDLKLIEDTEKKLRKATLKAMKRAASAGGC